MRDGHIAPATSNYGLNRGGGVQTRSLEEFYRSVILTVGQDSSVGMNVFQCLPFL